MEGPLCLITTRELLTLALPTHDWETGADRHQVIINCVTTEASPYWLCGWLPFWLTVSAYSDVAQWPGPGTRHWLLIEPVITHQRGSSTSSRHPCVQWKSPAFIFNGFSQGIDSDLFGNWRLIWTKARRLQSCWELILLRWDLNCCELSVEWSEQIAELLLAFLISL